MTRHRVRKVRPGDVFELRVDSGFVPLQAIGKHSSHGWAVRVVRGQSSSPLHDLSEIETAPDLYVVLMGDLAFEEAEHRLRFIGNAPLPDGHRERFPVFRASVSYQSDGRHKPGSWWLDDGQREWHVGDLTEKETHYPFRQFTPALALKDLIERGWDPEWEFKGADATEFARPSPPAKSDETASFFLIFPNAQSARAARDQLSHAGWFTSTTIEKIDEDSGRYVLVAQANSAAVDRSQIESVLERIAKTNGGDYDGDEWPLE